MPTTLRPMDVKRLPIARGLQRVKYMTHKNGWLAVLIEATNTADAWHVATTYLPSGTGSELIKVVSHTSSDVSGESPHSLSISPEAVLAIAMGSDGVRMYVLSPPAGQTSAKSQPWKTINDSCHFAKWIGCVRDKTSLVTVSRIENAVVNVYGHIHTPHRTMSLLFRIEKGVMQHFDASEPGFVCFITKNTITHTLHILTKREDDTFRHRHCDLNQPSLRRSNVPIDLTPISMAVGNLQVVIGFAPFCKETRRRLWNPPGLIEAYSIESGDLETRRLLPTSLPTSLASSDTRILIGTSDVSAGGTTNGAIYALTTKANYNYTVCCGDELNQSWAACTIHVDKLSWFFPVIQKIGDEIVTVVEYATVPTR